MCCLISPRIIISSIGLVVYLTTGWPAFKEPSPWKSYSLLTGFFSNRHFLFRQDTLFGIVTLTTGNIHMEINHGFIEWFSCFPNKNTTLA